MRMIDCVIRSMQDTGLIDGMSLEDADTLATAALEAVLDPKEVMLNAGENNVCGKEDVRYIFIAMIDAALNE